MSEVRSTELSVAYAFCREVAKREAKNFYYAFCVLPKHKSDAMCAVYAFMRKADDLADDESMSIKTRRQAMATWSAEWRDSRHTSSDDPVFLAVNDVQRRFGISDDLFDQLIAGTTMDLQETLPGVVAVHETTITNLGKREESFQVYETFDDLYRYCYLVASVVGLVTIRIFGYSDAKAEKLAEKTGIAFQLTNILRDVSEDAQRGRVYLPLDDMAAMQVEVEHFVLAAKGVCISAEVLNLLRLEITRAKEYYKASDELIPLLDPDTRPAMQVLVTIYRQLLERIAANPEQVFHSRVSVSTSQKLSILAMGIFKSLLARGRQ
jgi:phytoene synthase